MSDDAKPGLTYRAAGLDLDLYEQTLAGMAPFLKRTHTPRVLDGFGGFASLFSLDYNCRLFAKKLVLKNFVSIPQDQLLERLLELTLYTEENLR